MLCFVAFRIVHHVLDETSCEVQRISSALVQATSGSGHLLLLGQLGGIGGLQGTGSYHHHPNCLGLFASAPRALLLLLLLFLVPSSNTHQQSFSVSYLPSKMNTRGTCGLHQQPIPGAAPPALLGRLSQRWGAQVVLWQLHDKLRRYPPQPPHFQATPLSKHQSRK